MIMKLVQICTFCTSFEVFLQKADNTIYSIFYKSNNQFGFHAFFIKGISSIYNNPSAQIKINGHLSKSIKLERGTRQGCGLSPLLFALYIEPLAQRIRQRNSIKGISMNTRWHYTRTIF